jgi:hypothetical protein
MSGLLHRRSRRGHRPLAVERLEGRALLATLNINISAIPPLLVYQATRGVTNNLTIGVSTVGGVSSYTFHDAGEAINLLAGATTAGWTSIDPNTVTGPTSSLGAMQIGLVDGADTLTVNQTEAPIAFGTGNTGNKTLDLGTGPGSVQGIHGAITLSDPGSTTAVTVDDSADTVARQGTLSLSAAAGQATLAGLAPQPLLYTPAEVGTLTVKGGVGGSTLTVDYGGGDPVPPQTSGLIYNGGSGSDTLALRGPLTSATEEIDGTTANSGSIQFSLNSIDFSGVTTLNDTGSTSSAVFVTKGDPRQVTIADGPVVNALPTVKISSGDSPASFPNVQLTNKNDLVVSLDTTVPPGGGSSVAVTLANPTPAAGLATLTVSPSTDTNVVNVNARPAGVDTLVQIGSGAGSVNVAAAGLLSSGSLRVAGSPMAPVATPTRLTYDANGDLVTITPTSIAAGAGTTAQQTLVSFQLLGQLDVINSPDLPLTATPATVFPAIASLTFNATIATFTDADPNGKLGDYRASIDWGDGTTTPSAPISAATDGRFAVSGSHTYAQPGTYTITATIRDLGTSFTEQSPDGLVAVTVPGGATATARIAFNAVRVPPQFVLSGLPIAATEGQPFQGGVATFGDTPAGLVASGFSATIAWGDGTPDTPGTITQPGGQATPFVIVGAHTYRAPGSYPVSVVLRGGDGQTLSTSTTATVAADLTVYNTRDDTNPGSLRHALLEVDQGLGSLVTFRIPGTGPFTIAPAAPLPTVTRPAVIDARTQPGSSPGHPLVVVSGANLPAENTDGLTIAGGNTTVAGLVVNGFTGVGIVLEGPGGDTLLGNFLGTDAAGSRAVPNFQGLLILGTSNNQVGGTGTGDGNLISGNTSAGIQILNNQAVTDPTQSFATTGNASGNRILGNKVGTDAAGTSAVGNGQGIFVNDAPSNVIGGDRDRGAGNLISGNRSIGLQILGADATGNVVQGNAIGTDASRSGRLSNGSGVLVYAGPGNGVDQSSGSSTANTIAFNTQFDLQVRPLSAGPTVESVGATPATGGNLTGLTVSFGMYMDRARASNPANYVVTLLNANLRPIRRIAVVSATYNGIYRTVDLVLASPIARTATFSLRILGRAPGGLSDSSGNFLAGNTSVARTSRGSDNLTDFRQGQPFVPTMRAARRGHAVNKTHSARPAPRG